MRQGTITLTPRPAKDDKDGVGIAAKGSLNDQCSPPISDPREGVPHALYGTCPHEDGTGRQNRSREGTVASTPNVRSHRRSDAFRVPFDRELSEDVNIKVP